MDKAKLLYSNFEPKNTIVVIICYLIKVPTFTYFSNIHVGLLRKFLWLRI